MAEVWTTSGMNRWRLGRDTAALMTHHPEARCAAALRVDTPRRVPTARSTRVAGLIRSTSTSTVPGRPCWSGIAVGVSGASCNSTRITPSRASVATLVTVAATAPVLRPRETVQPQPCRLPGLHPAQGDGREKVGHHPQRASREYHAQRVPLADHGAWLQGGDFPQVSR